MTFSEIYPCTHQYLPTLLTASFSLLTVFWSLLSGYFGGYLVGEFFAENESVGPKKKIEN